MAEGGRTETETPLTLHPPSTEGEGSTRSAQSTSVSAAAPALGVKRREYQKWSAVWDHFDEYITADGKKRCKCKYCPKNYACGSKTAGTSTLRSHVSVCPGLPSNIKSSSQTQLTTSSGHDLDSDVAPTNLIAWKFEQMKARRSLVEMIVAEELPFSFVERPYFRRYMKACQPLHAIPSRSTMSRDCYQLFCDEKAKLKCQMKKSANTICLTTDTWTSLQQINYMCVTAHFIDQDWKLQKKVINFCPVSSHRGHDIGKVLEATLIDWEWQNVFTITVDNASSNDVAIAYIKDKIVNWTDRCVLQGKWLHVRCAAHILNLIVQGGLKTVGESVNRVRAAVKFVRQSLARIKRFTDYAVFEKCDCSKSLVLDVSTHWNSTYLMLNVAILYQRAFDRLYLEDATYREDVVVKIGAPTSDDWKNVKALVIFLQHFYDLTIKISASKYVTSETFLDDIWVINDLLKKSIVSEDENLASVAALMQIKYDKYWGMLEKFNMLVFIASMLDPNNKFEFVQAILVRMYGEREGVKLAAQVKDGFVELFNDYKRIYSTPTVLSLPHSSHSTPSDKHSSPSSSSVQTNKGTEFGSRMELRELKNTLKRKRLEDSGEAKSELDRYLTEIVDEGLETSDGHFSVLGWWKINSPRFPILSLMARDILAIPMSTVASESVFSTGGRVLDAFRSSLTPKIVQALICTQDWLRSSASPVNVEENLEDLEKLE